eukprot:TRINITY_DN8875_c0_g1_i1.p1 TRINITY_DN8875_c0_g1~~TRINITY_DN8875_c0_g1_i1.p1  ORF type:complete len:462 (-),score=94.84 TRINITY_DN8875_c0_g1_i1:111-1496(-)
MALAFVPASQVLIGAAPNVPLFSSEPSAAIAKHGFTETAQPIQGTSTKAPLLLGFMVGAAAAVKVKSSVRRTRQGRAGYLRLTAAAKDWIEAEVQDAQLVDDAKGQQTEQKDQQQLQEHKEPGACPLCQRPLTTSDDTGATCESCGVGFPMAPDGGFLDLTIGSAMPIKDFDKSQKERSQTSAKPSEESQGLLQRLPFVKQTDAIAKSLGLPQSSEIEALGMELLNEPRRLLTREQKPAGTSTFQSPLVSFAYERGWRSQFASSGFPGPDEEFRMAQEFFKDAEGLQGDVLLDASCGSGLFSRRFVASGSYRTVVALDFSESMLRQVDDFAKKEFGAGYANEAPGKTALKLIRADIARLPFESNSLGGVHASAAIHCWPAPENAIAEIARVLRPGGVLVLSTFRPRGPLSALGRGRNPYRFWEEEELRKLTGQCGLVDFKAITREPAFIMVRVSKPKLPEQ